MKLARKSKITLPSSFGGIISRIAPTPSGYLHLGNVYNFLLTYLFTRAKGGFLNLRIDDYDIGRYRREFVQNIFDVLEFLQLDYDGGARNLAQFEAKFSFKFRLNEYKKALDGLKGEIYACECSKHTPNAYKNGIYQGLCRYKNLKFTKGLTSLKILVDSSDELGREVGENLGDFMLYKKDDTPAYNLASVVDDELLGVNFVVRGEDLLGCTQAQIYLSRRLGYKFQNANFIHHALFMDGDKKLSKSSNAPAIDFKNGAKFYYKIVADRLALNPLCCDKLSNLAYEFKISQSKIQAL
ncbi:glutamate--tRNA ligase family protein [Campylobacter curvus]|uniref:glutamate--tRNA ligase family protein n=1 Tax=Campylobacter curvus TaxID=200 RepID=UPI0003690E33|nr:glutamate--tRNA ligase family protein [Campylobacter curvus]QKF60879.1 glutamyl-queuosine tRNA(Asp) synthetase [Campylobacter curvus]UEB49199.1 hypothetical protein LK426_06095 [Campylobacter curvus]